MITGFLVSLMEEVDDAGRFRTSNRPNNQRKNGSTAENAITFLYTHILASIYRKRERSLQILLFAVNRCITWPLRCYLDLKGPGCIPRRQFSKPDLIAQ